MAATITKRTYYGVFVALLALLALTAALSFAPLGWAEAPVAYTIGAAKAILIILYFMHVRKASTLTAAFAGSAFLWLGILLVLSMSDYLTRSWLPSGEQITSRTFIPPPPSHAPGPLLPTELGG